MLHLLAALHRSALLHLTAAMLSHLLHVLLHHLLMLRVVFSHEFPLFFFQSLPFFVVFGGDDLVHEFVHFQHVILGLPNVLFSLFLGHVSHHAAHAPHHSTHTPHATHATHLVLTGRLLRRVLFGEAG